VVTGAHPDGPALHTVRTALRAAGLRLVDESGGAAPRTVTVWLGTPSGNDAIPEVLHELHARGPQAGRPEGYALATGRAAGRPGIQVVLAGADADGTYYAAQTFRQLLERAARGRLLPSVALRDRPAMRVRGVVEGFYGEPWTHRARLRQLDFYGAHKMNTYVYAPKDDPYHRE
jgi:hyaluronoglucosaminidase